MLNIIFPENYLLTVWTQNHLYEIFGSDLLVQTFLNVKFKSITKHVTS